MHKIHENNAFSIWTKKVWQTIATDGVFRYGISMADVMWRQPNHGGFMRIYFGSGDQLGILTYAMGRGQ